jgi:hypothetical protein
VSVIGDQSLASEVMVSGSDFVSGGAEFQYQIGLFIYLFQ